MNTIILFWNPAISSFKLDDYQELIENLEYEDMNWSVWEHEKAHSGDRFFMVRCGEGKTGICMSGYFCSDSYQDDDWSGRGRVTYYMDLAIDTIIHPDYRPVLSTEKLMQTIPGFDWTGGHSGRLLDADKAEHLEKSWKDFLQKQSDMFMVRCAQQEVDPEDYM